MTNFHIDVWTAAGADLVTGVVDFGGDGFGGANPDTRGDARTTLTAGQWTSIDVSIADLRLGDNSLGKTRLVGRRVDSGLLFETLEVDGEAVKVGRPLVVGANVTAQIQDRQVRLALSVCENAQVGDLVGQAVGLGLSVARASSQQDDQGPELKDEEVPEKDHPEE